MNTSENTSFRNKINQIQNRAKEPSENQIKENVSIISLNNIFFAVF